MSRICRIISCYWIYVAALFVSFYAYADDDIYGSQIKLQQVFRYVYDSNPSLQAARAELDATRELYPQARSGWLPSISGEASIYRSEIDSSNFGSADGATTKDLTLNLDQPIWRGGQTFARAAESKAIIAAGEQVLRQAEQDIFLDTLRAYIDVVQAREILALRRKNERLLYEEHEAAQERHVLGDITLTSVQQAKARLNRAQAEFIVAMNNLDQADFEFEQITGMTTPADLAYPWVSFEFPDTIDEMILRAQEHHPELILARYQYEAAEHDIDAIFSEMLPQISAFASYNKQFAPQPGIVDQNETQTVGLRASIAFYEGGLTRSRVREARHSTLQQKYLIHDIERRIRQDVQSSWNDFRSSQAQINSRSLEVASSREALKGVQEEARVGQRAVLDVLDADLDTINAELALIRARRNHIIAQFSLAADLGMLAAENLQLEKPSFD